MLSGLGFFQSSFPSSWTDCTTPDYPGKCLQNAQKSFSIYQKKVFFSIKIFQLQADFWKSSRRLQNVLNSISIWLM